MSNVKKPNWDKFPSPGTFNQDEIPDPNNVAQGMTASLRLNGITVHVRIKTVLAGNNIEGQITKIDSEAETIEDLSVGDAVYIPQGFYGLTQTVKT